MTRREGLDVGGHDLADVEDLCRLVLVAQRLGCRVRLDDVDRALVDLLELAGVGDVIMAREQRDMP